jgi:hypothetical protein
MRFSTRTTIDAPVATVWSILTDVPAWPTWNTTVTSTEGTAALGATVTVRVTANPGRAFPVKVTALDAPTRMVWTGGMPLGLFTGTRTYSLTPVGSTTEFAMEEVYTGLLASMVTRSIPDLGPSFDEFAACLRTRAESAVRDPS